MKTFQSHASFYVELSPEEIKVCPKHGVPTSYPIWLGKNRAIMREAIADFKKNPPETFVDCIGRAAHLGLCGMGSHTPTIPELFTESQKSLDNDKIFW